MRLAILFFAFGIWACQQLAELPQIPFMAVAALCALGGGAALLLRKNSPKLAHLICMLAAGVAGFAWAVTFAQARLADSLNVEDEGRDLVVTGVVSSLPQTFESGSRFELAVEQAEGEIPKRLQLAWYKGPPQEIGDGRAAFRPVHAGERWQMTVRLKRPHSNLNPHGFDYEAVLFERGIRATGYVRAAPEAVLLKELVPEPAYLVERLRELVRDRIYRALPDRDYAGVLVALVVGDQRAIETGFWQVFNRTGTTHLMSISGLHITMMGALAFGMVGWVWRRAPPLALRLPAQKAGVAAGALAALLYSLLAGFGVPAQRTLYMLTVVGAALWLGRTTSPSRVLALALLLVLLIDPWAVLSAGFWLSFGAVGLLFYIGSGRVGQGHWLSDWARAQWAVTIGSVPALLAIFQQLSLVSPLANAAAIPVVSFVVTPLAIVGSLIPSSLVLELAHLVLDALMRLLEGMADWPWAVWQQAAPEPWMVLLGSSGMLVLLLPRGFPARWTGVVLLAPILLHAPGRPEVGEMKVTVLDVGQGLAVHVQTRSHDLLYDTGPQYSPDANGGNRIILPYLRAAGVRRLDGVIVTHQDNDHSGGALSVLDGIPFDWVASSLPADHGLRQAKGHRPCYAGQDWEWDGIRFEMLHPMWSDYSAARKSNDFSCVLRIVAPGGRVLLTADIEAVSEAALLQREKSEALRAELLVVPHHGSRTSSTQQFLEAVAPQAAIFTVGYRNRFRHPNTEVVARYERMGARLLRSDRDGAITFRIGPGGIETGLERRARPRYWHDRQW